MRATPTRPYSGAWRLLLRRVALYRTDQHPQPDPPPRITAADNLAAWLVAHPDYATQCIAPAPIADGMSTFQRSFDSGSSPAEWIFQLQIRNGAGFVVSFSAGTPSPSGRPIQ